MYSSHRFATPTAQFLSLPGQGFFVEGLLFESGAHWSQPAAQVAESLRGKTTHAVDSQEGGRTGFRFCLDDAVVTLSPCNKYGEIDGFWPERGATRFVRLTDFRVVQ